MIVPRRPTLVLVVGFNAARHLDKLLSRLKAIVDPTSILLVDDGSTDETLAIATRHHIATLKHRTNRGKGAALKTGFQFALENNYRAVLTIDADLQHLPEEIPRLAALNNGARLIVGSRSMRREQMPLDRRLSNLLTSLVISLFIHRRVPDSQCGFRLIPVSLLRKITLKCDGFLAESELLLRAGQLEHEIAEVPITTVYDRSESNIRRGRDTLSFLRLVFGRLWW